MNSVQNKLNSMFGRIADNSRMNYEELKIAIGLEDYFFDVLLKPLAENHGFKISFKGKDIYFNK